MLELVLPTLLGVVLTWPIARYYYVKADSTAPTWWSPVERRLLEMVGERDTRPSNEELLELFQEALQGGEVSVHPVLGCVACPACGASASGFRDERLPGDLETGEAALRISCPECGWSEVALV